MSWSGYTASHTASGYTEIAGVAMYSVVLSNLKGFSKPMKVYDYTEKLDCDDSVSSSKESNLHLL